ncbi:MAG: transglutaminase domain-containing protein [Bacteroidota bacterium]
MSQYAVKPPNVRVTLKKRTYNTSDIIAQVQEVLRTDVDDTANFARQFAPTREGMRALYQKVHNRITYVEDPNFYQWVQTPSFLWHHTRRGDCKSLAVFISTVLQNMGVAHLIRYVSYSWVGKYSHVYVVALIDGDEIPLDITFGKQENAAWDAEKSYRRKKDYEMEPGLYKLGNTGTVSLTTREKQYVDNVNATLSEMELALADIPDSVVTSGGGDITQKTKGELDRQIWKDRYEIEAGQAATPAARRQLQAAAEALDRGQVAGIYGLDGTPLGRQVDSILRNTRSNAPAFSDFTLSLGNAPTDPAISGLFKKIGGFFRNVGNKFKNLFKKFVNWVWKGPAKLMGGYYLFLWAKKRVVRSREMRRRIAAQEKSFNWIQKKGKFSRSQLMGVMENGIKKNTGASPQQIFGMAKANHIGALPAVLVAIGKFVVKAIGWVIKVVQKIAGLFKGRKSEAGVINESTSSDVAILQEEARLEEEATRTNTGASPNSNTNNSGGGSGAGALAALAVVPFLLRAA